MASAYRDRLAFFLWDENAHPRDDKGRFGDVGTSEAASAAQDHVQKLTGEEPQPAGHAFNTADGWNYTRLSENAVVKEASKDIAGASDGKVSPGEAREWVQAWVDGKPVSPGTWKVLQGSIKAEFGLKDAPTKHLGRMPKDAEMARAFVRAQFNATQAVLKAQGITELTVYRGQPAIEGTQVQLQPGSSWSLDRSLAGSVASYSHGEGGRVLKATVPADRILAMPTTGGCLQQAEVVLLGGTLTVEQSNARDPR